MNSGITFCCPMKKIDAAKNSAQMTGNAMRARNPAMQEHPQVQHSNERREGSGNPIGCGRNSVQQARRTGCGHNSPDQEDAGSTQRKDKCADFEKTGAAFFSLDGHPSRSYEVKRKKPNNGGSSLRDLNRQVRAHRRHR
jgi:hypothetical protein